jgi:Family of unknown function (DUF6526)
MFMPNQQPQNLATHTRFDPLFHFFLAPVFALALIMTLIHLFAHLGEGGFRDHLHAALMVLLAVALLTWLFKTRLYSLKVQDRIIRLEERLRLMQLLPEPLRARIPELTESQLIALRFASDAELPKLAERALNEKLSRKEIKKTVQNWRPDYWRI